MDKKHIYENLQVGDLVYLDPSKVRTTWAKKWAEKQWEVEIISIASSKVNGDTALSGVCSQDSGQGTRHFDADRILSFADELSQIKQQSQRL